MKDILYFNTLEDIKLTAMIRVLKKKEEHDYSKDYLTFEALEDGTFSLSIPTYVDSTYMTSVSYSTDDGENWTTTTIDNTAQTITTPTINAGSKVLWKGIGKQTSKGTSTTNSSRFSATCNFNVNGNIMSLLYGDDFADETTFLTNSKYTFCYLFSSVSNNTKLINAGNLILPATTLVNSCYCYMFQNCTALTTPPELPATTLAVSCYSNMFKGCTALTAAPILPATEMKQSCYSNMFKGCTALTTAPDLPATTTLASYCYEYMFQGCTSLTTAPVLSATTLTSYCYQYMFYDCSSLNYIKMLATNMSGTNCLYNWVKGVAANGTFVKNSAALWDVTGDSGIPTGWTIETSAS